MTCSLPIVSINLPPHYHHHHHHKPPLAQFSCSSVVPSSLILYFRSKNRHICCSLPANSGSSSYDSSEEARWLREEQRWLREEQRWLREEQRWQRERETLLREINSLKLQIEEIQHHNSIQGATVSDTISNIAKLLQVLKEGEVGKNNVNRIPESGSSSVPLVVEAKEEELEVVKEVIKVSEREPSKDEKKNETLRKGSEGDEVRAMQEALLKLGFYSGEEDMEFSSFSTGTERAVKTWQASLGAREDGIMTTELLEILYREQKLGHSSLTVNQNPEKHGETNKNENGTPVASITEIQQTIVKEEGVTEVEVSEHRVFLLGENRWEEPARLSRSNRKPDAKSGDASAAKKCLSCRGEGQLLCMECDGTGEPNLEPQFLEWIDEGAKCPYCEGLGYIKCDVCEGKKVMQT